MKRKLLISGAVFVLIILWFGLNSSQTVVESPLARITVIDDGTKSALVNATVAIRWKSKPHSRLHRETRYVTDKAGVLALEKKTSEKEVYPLCLHGVPANYIEICVAHDGFKDVLFELEDPGKKFAARISLHRGESLECVESTTSYRHSQEEREDLSSLPNVWTASDLSKNDAVPPAQE